MAKANILDQLKAIDQSKVKHEGLKSQINTALKQFPNKEKLIEAEIKNYEKILFITKGAFPDSIGAAKAPAKKPEAPAKKAPSKPTPAKPKAKKAPKKKEVIKIGGVEVKAENCDELIEAVLARREKAKKSGRKTKTKPVFERITVDVVDSVKKAIKTIPEKRFKTETKKTIEAIESLEMSAIAFARSFKRVLGKDYKTSQAEKMFDELDKIIADLKKKYTKK